MPASPSPRLKPLSDRRQAILRFIRQHITDTGFPPTVREIGEAVGLASSSTVQAHIEVLREQGLILREPYLTRAIRLPGAETKAEPSSSPADALAWLKTQRGTLEFDPDLGYLLSLDVDGERWEFNDDDLQSVIEEARAAVEQQGMGRAA